VNATLNQSTQPRRSASDTESVNTQAGLLHMEAIMATASNSDNAGTMAAFTPGTWHWISGVEDTHRELVSDAADDSILYHGGNWSMTEANARLIAASPSLFSALTNLVALVMSGDATKEEAEGFWADAIAALAIAEGGAL
jgi:hypothetical protein